MVDAPAIVEGPRRGRIEADGLLVVLDRALVVALVLMGAAAIVEDERGIGVELDGLIVVRNGANVVPLVLVGIAAIVQGDGQARLGELAGLDGARAVGQRQIRGRRLGALLRVIVPLRPRGSSGQEENKNYDCSHMHGSLRCLTTRESGP